MGFVCDLHHPLLLVSQLPRQFVEHVRWIALVVQMHVVGQVLGQHRGLGPLALLASVQNFVEFFEGRVGVSAPADVLLCHRAVDVERPHSMLGEEDPFVLVLEE